MIRADRSGGVAVLCGATDIGQGSDSILAYLPAEVLGLEPSDVRVHPADTDLTPVDLGDGGETYRSVTSGLEEGDRVILFPGDALQDGARVRARGN